MEVKYKPTGNMPRRAALPTEIKKLNSKYIP